MKLQQIRQSYIKNEITKQDYIEKMFEIHSCLIDYSKFIPQTDIGKIEIIDDEVILTTRKNKIRMVADLDDNRIIPIEILNFGTYEQEILDMMVRIIDPCSTVFDIGANVGWYTLNFSKLIRDVKIYLFEPIPVTFSILERNLKLNNVFDIFAHNYGFAEKEKDIEFYYYPECSGNASMANLTENENIEKVKCQVKRVDDFIKDNMINVDFVKIDVEGAELHVLQGSLNTLAEIKPIVFCEMLRKWSAKFNYHPNDIIKLLKEIGYHCFIIENNRLKKFTTMDENTRETNFLFLHDQKHAKKMETFVTKD